MLRGARYGTRDLEKARKFYDEIAGLLGAKRVIDRDELTAYQSEAGGLFVIGKPLAGEATVGNGTQVVFDAPSPAVVDAVHAKALQLGGKCEGPPGYRGPKEMGFYAAYIRDLDGNKIVVTHRGQQ